METLWEPKEYLTHQGTEYDQVLIKRNLTGDGDTLYVRMPHKRGAITPTSQTPYQAPRRTTPPPPPVINPTSATNQTRPNLEIFGTTENRLTYQYYETITQRRADYTTARFRV
jgi:hypothetical protein